MSCFRSRVRFKRSRWMSKRRLVITENEGFETWFEGNRRRRVLPLELYLLPTWETSMMRHSSESDGKLHPTPWQMGAREERREVCHALNTGRFCSGQSCCKTCISGISYV